MCVDLWIWIVAGLSCFAYIFLVGAQTGDNALKDNPTRMFYFDALKTMVAAAGISVAILANGFQRILVNPCLVRNAAAFLVACVLLCVATMFVLSLSYDRAGQGAVKLGGLFVPLILGGVALFSFIMGFVHLVVLASTFQLRM